MIIKADARALPLRDESIDCVVTSPPYWGLRDYGVAGQLGLESSPQEYVDSMVAVFREASRVLKPAGTLWLNLGDCYNTDPSGMTNGKRGSTLTGGAQTFDLGRKIHRNTNNGLKPKDLVGIPWRVAFALQTDGWWLRSDIIWAKSNPMPESVTDRPTRAHEYLFLLAKSERYYYDADAIMEDATGRPPGNIRPSKTVALRKPTQKPGWEMRVGARDRRNARSVWTIPTQPYSGAHFATFPEELARRCIRAVCPVGGLVLDPFAGSGTVGRVAIQEGRRAVLCDLAYHDLAKARIREVQPRLLVNA